MEVKSIVEYHRIQVYKDIWGIRTQLIFVHPSAQKMAYFARY